MLVVSPSFRTVVHLTALRRGLVALLAAAMVLPPDAAIAAAAAGPADGLAEERLEVDTKALDSDARVPVERRIREGVAQAIRLFQEYAGKDLDAGARIVVRVVPLSGDEVGYRVTVEGLHEGRVVEGSPPPFECPACTETEMVDMVVERVGLLLPKLQPGDEPPPQAEEDASEDEPARNDLVEPSFEDGEKPDDTPRPKLGGLGKAGIATLAVGAVGVGVGLGLGLRQDTWHTNNDDAGNAGYLSTKTPGWAVLGVGGALVLTGAVLLAYDMRHNRQGRRTAVAPYLDGQRVGLALVRRF